MPAGKILILTDGKAGHENQSRAFARALGRETVMVPVKFKSPLHKALSYLLDHLGIHTLSLFTPIEAIAPKLETRNPAPAYAAVIGTGSGTFYAAKTLARAAGVKCGVVLYPRGYKISTFDCILAPAFDRPPKAPNVVEIPANLVANDDAFYKSGTKAFLERHPSAKDAEAVAVIIGGPNKCSTMTADWMRRELEKIFGTYKPETQNSKPETRNQKLEFWVTTSRRTPPAVEAVVDTFPFDYKLIYSRDHFNPIPGFVSLAKTLYVTAESTGMLSEACTFGTAEVRVMDNLNPGPHKFRRFAETCAAMGAEKFDLSQPIAAARSLLAIDA
ncbi:MAG: mitochondrial fission ELM1 family protein [Kiritimatiellae bacterium]|nr:mitochondrial fission ELM1 family protein [Kiritimatiellia bacterium]